VLDDEKHVGIERMSLIEAYREAAVTATASSTIPEMTTIVRTVTAVSRANSSPYPEGVTSVEGAISIVGDVVAPALPLDQMETQAVSVFEVGTSMRADTGAVTRSEATVAAEGRQRL